MPATSTFFHTPFSPPRIPSLSNPQPRWCHRLRCIRASGNGHREEEEKKDAAFSFPEKPWAWTGGVVAPTAPWMRGPLLLSADDVLDLSSGTKFRKKRAEKVREDDSLTGRVKGGRSRHTMRRIVERVARLGEIDPLLDEKDWGSSDVDEEPVFSLPVEDQGVQKLVVSWKVPWARPERVAVFRRMKKERLVTTAELTLAADDLARLRSDARKMTKWVKAKKAGVTEEVVDEIRKTWESNELAMVKLVEPLSRNMDRAMEIVETKTGGLVVWSKKDTLVVYRGCNYRSTSKISNASNIVYSQKCSPSLDDIPWKSGGTRVSSSAQSSDEVDGNVPVEQDKNTQLSSMFIDVDTESVRGSLYEREANRLLDGLGPRFIDWWMAKPLPVDADLLPEVVPGYKTPFRHCPPHVNPKLTDDELTYLRKLARPLPTHFALGKNTKLQGLAAAIIKLWEKSTIAKIAVKMGIPNTHNELMSCELKRLTGGTLILRNKFYIILYRGKDFLPGGVADSVIKRETELRNQQLHEEQARQRAVETFHASNDLSNSSSVVGTFVEFQGIKTNYNFLEDQQWRIKIKIDAEKEKLEKELKRQEHQLSILRLKIERSNKNFAKLSPSWRTSEDDTDKELLTKEERQAFRKIGLQMDEVLLLGRRGIYDGVIGNIHLHWKHRELVKVITMQKELSQISYTARFLEIESGGILISVEKFRTGHAIIIYRGKNYKAPVKLLPEHLLTKREALDRSMEVQRRGSLKFFAHQRERSIWDLKCKLRNLEERAKMLTSGEAQPREVAEEF